MAEFLSRFWFWTLVLLYLSAAISATAHAVLWKRDSRAALGWVGLIWFAPLLGAVAYFGFGINRIQRKAFSLRLQEAWRQGRRPSRPPCGTELPDELLRAQSSLSSLVTLGERLTARPLLPGNLVQPLIDGDQAFPAMLQAIESAERSISLLSYIFDSDRAGEAFLQALLGAQRRGVQVRVLIDHVGSTYGRPNMITRLRSAGLRVEAFLPTRVPRLFKYANLRNHRKVLVIDGRVGFTGGTNIREGHWRSLQPRSPVRCLHFRLEGPIVGELQEVFAVDWVFASGESLNGDVWFPELKPAGSVWARSIADGPDEDFEKLVDTLLGALSVARSSVRVVTPYFLPQAPLIHALNVTSLRGVDLDIVIPAENNVKLVQWAVTAQLWQLVEKGCRVFLTPSPFDHSKLMVVDGMWSLIGSTNWDSRSLRLNFEYNVECYDPVLATELNKLIDIKVAGAHRVSLAELDGRGFPVRLRDGLARLLTPYL